MTSRGHHRRHAPVTEVGLPEVVGFVLGAGAMATAMAALEANLSESEAARRLVREGITAELHRAVEHLPGHHPARPAIPVQRTGPGAADPGDKIVSARDGNLESCRGKQGES